MIMTNKAILRGMIRLESDCYYLWPACYALQTPCVHSTPLSIHSNQSWLEPPRRWSAYQTMSHILTCELAVCQRNWKKYILEWEEALFQDANMWRVSTTAYHTMIPRLRSIMWLWKNTMAHNWPGAFSPTRFTVRLCVAAAVAKSATGLMH